MLLVGANVPPGQNVYFHCPDDTVVQLSDAFRPVPSEQLYDLSRQARGQAQTAALLMAASISGSGMGQGSGEQPQPQPQVGRSRLPTSRPVLKAPPGISA